MSEPDRALPLASPAPAQGWFEAARARIDAFARAGVPHPPEAAPVEDDPPPADPLARTLRFIRLHQPRLLGRLMLAAVLSNLLLLALPLYSGLVFDRVIPHAALDTLWALSLGVALALAADFALRRVRLKLQEAIAGRAAATLSAQIMRQLLDTENLSAPRLAGPLALRLREIEHLAQVAPMLMVALAVDVPFLALVFGLIWLNGGPAVAAPLLGVAVLAGVHHLSHRAALATQARAATLAQAQANRVIEVVEGLEVIKASRRETSLQQRFEQTFDAGFAAGHTGRFWQGLAAYAGAVVGQGMIVLVTLIGVYQVTSGAMTLGALTTCTLLVSRIIAPVGQLVMLLHRAGQIRATLASLGEAPLAGENGGQETPRGGEIRFEGVAFAYPGASAPQVEGLSFTISPGEKVAIIGRSGSGKSTLLKLAMRFCAPTGGAVLVDGRDIRHYAPGALRACLGYCGQTPGLMDDTLLANLTFAAPDATPEAVEAMARLTGLFELAARHPQGFGLRVGPRGEALSGGERQAVALARVLLAQPKVLLLDEPTAAMDTVLEAQLARELKPHLEGRTLVLATHRAPLLDLVDRLIWIDHGRILADGPKDEVLRRLKGAA